MLVFSVLLLAASTFAAPSVLPAEYPQGEQVVYQQQPNYHQTQHYVDQSFGGVPVNTEIQQQDQTHSPNHFPSQNQPDHNNGPVSDVTSEDVGAVNQVPDQAVFGRSNNQQYNVIPNSHVSSQEVVQPEQQVDIESTSEVVQPKHVPGHDHEGFVGVAEEHVSMNDPAFNAKIVQQEMDVSPDGSFRNVWSSDNGINVQEEGTVKHVGDADVAVQQGVVSYVDNDGNHFELKYVADENGFNVVGPHIPTPPPIPDAIARGLKFIAEHPSTEAPTVQNDKDQPEQQQPVVDDN